MKNKLAVSLKDLTAMATAHDAGSKRILFNGSETSSAITQLAYGTLPAGETIAAHQHETMEEFFYFLVGKGTYTISEEVIGLEPATAVRIPPATQHILHASEDLEFVYFGIAINL